MTVILIFLYMIEEIDRYAFGNLYNHNNFCMPEEKIVRTVFDITPLPTNDNVPDYYDCENDPTFIRKMELAKPALEALYKKYSHLGNLNEEINEETK